jgi:predicted dehydrogenase
MNMDTPGDTLIFGKKGGLRIPSTNCWNGSVGGPMKIYHQVAGERVETVIPVLDNGGKDLFDMKIRSFLDAIITGGPSPIPASEILYNQAIIDGISRSAELGREIEIEIPEI